MSLRWPQVLAWRLRRQLLDPVGDETVEGVVTRLGAVPAQPDIGAELAIGVRRTGHRPADVALALSEGRLAKCYAFRGATHLLTPEPGASYLAVRASSRMWERTSWQSFYDLAPSDWPAFRARVREVLADGPLTRGELAKALDRSRRFRHLHGAITEGNDTLVKPLHWQGDICFGPTREGQSTFQRLDSVPGWAGPPDLDEAGVLAVQSYVRTYGPATADHVQYWLGEGLGARRRRITSWIDALADRLVEVDVEGSPAYVHRDDLDELTRTTPTAVVRLLPGYDQWVLGPGTADPHVVPPERRSLVSKGAHLVVAGGVVVGTWSVSGAAVAINLFAEAEHPSEGQLEDEVGRVAAVLGRELERSVAVG